MQVNYFSPEFRAPPRAGHKYLDLSFLCYICRVQTSEFPFYDPFLYYTDPGKRNLKAGNSNHTFYILMEYNTNRSKLIMPEYGRNIQQMVDYVRTIQDPEVRQRNARSIIELMGVLNPHLKNVEDFRHKLWDHLFLIADFDIDVASPYPLPTKEKLFRRPDPVPYPKVHRKNRHLGKNLGAVIDKALAETDEEKRRGFTHSIAYYMKLAYTNWHREPVHDDMIKEELSEITGGELNYTAGGIKVRFDNNRQGQPQQGNGNGNNNNGGAHKKNANARNNNFKGNNNQARNGNNNNNNNKNNNGNNNKNRNNNNNKNRQNKPGA